MILELEYLNKTKDFRGRMKGICKESLTPNMLMRSFAVTKGKGQSWVMQPYKLCVMGIVVNSLISASFHCYISLAYTSK